MGDCDDDRDDAQECAECVKLKQRILHVEKTRRHTRAAALTARHRVDVLEKERATQDTVISALETQLATKRRELEDVEQHKTSLLLTLRAEREMSPRHPQDAAHIAYLTEQNAALLSSPDTTPRQFQRGTALNSGKNAASVASVDAESVDDVEDTDDRQYADEDEDTYSRRDVGAVGTAFNAELEARDRTIAQLRRQLEGMQLALVSSASRRRSDADAYETQLETVRSRLDRELEHRRQMQCELQSQGGVLDEMRINLKTLTLLFNDVVERRRTRK